MTSTHRNYAVALCTVLGAAVWLWPLTAGPLSAMWPNLFALTVGVILFNVLPRSSAGGKTAVATGWLVAALISAVIALMQYFDLEDPFFPFLATTDPGYAYANARQTNHLATLLGAGLLALLWAVRTRRLRFHAVWMAGLLATAMAATASRTGAMHLLLITAMVAWWAEPQRRRMLLWCAWVLAVYVAAVLALPWLLQHTQGIEGRDLFARMGAGASCSSRKVLWSNVLHLISLKPLTGWGWGELAYAHYATLFDGPRFCEKLTNAHNLPLHFAVELGIPLALLLSAGAVWMIARHQPWRAKDPARQMAWSVLALIGVHSLLEYPLWFGNFQVMVALCIWLLWPAHACDGVARSAEITRAAIPWRRAMGSIALLSVFTYVAWDYFRVSQLYTPTQERAVRYRDDTFSKARGTWLFSSQVLFAQVTTADLDTSNAAPLLQASLAALHISPEPRVIQKVIESALLLEKNNLAQEHAARYKAANPINFAQWEATKSKGPMSLVGVALQPAR